MISIIVPVYKVEKYLRRCVDSILAQTFRDFELLLVDDGSPDSCDRICDEYMQKDSRVRVFHKQNGGLSDARNYGLERIKGNYITFIDSDDYVGPNYLRILMDMMKENDVGISAITHVCTSCMEPDYQSSEDVRELIPNKKTIRAMTQNQIIFSAWGKLIKKDLLQKVTFPVGKLFENNFIIPYIMCQCDMIAKSSSVQYYWFKRTDSIMGTVSEKKFYDWEEGIDKLLEYTKINYPQDVEYVEGWIATFIWHIAIDQSVFTTRYWDYAKHVKEKYGYILRKAWRLPVINWKRKSKAAFFMLSPSMYRNLRKGWKLIRHK